MEGKISNDFSAKKGCLHSLFLILIFFAVNISVGAALASEPEALGKVCANLIPVVGLIGMLSSYFIQRRSFIIGSALAIAVCATLPLYLVFAVSQEGLAESEKQLSIDSKKIYSLEFGFSLPHPGESFTLLPEMPVEMRANMETQPGMFGWMLEDSVSAEVVIILIFKQFNEPDEQHFRRFAKGFKSSMGVQQYNVIEDTLIWTSGDREFRFLVNSPNEYFLGSRWLASEAGCEKAFYVGVNTISAEAEGLKSVRAGLSIKYVGLDVQQE
jgi:hypothetical protein